MSERVGWDKQRVDDSSKQGMVSHICAEMPFLSNQDLQSASWTSACMRHMTNMTKHNLCNLGHVSC